MDFKELYFRYNKKLIFIPIILFVLSIIVILLQFAQIGDIVDKDVTLKGGVSITITSQQDFSNLEEHLSDKFNTEVIVRKLSEFGSDKQRGFIVELSDVEGNIVKEEIESFLGLKLTQDNFSIEETGSSLAESFYKQMLIALLVAFALMSLVVMIAFRRLIPSAAIIASGVFDLTVTIAVINLMGIKMSTAGIAALLLILGYSLDTDILLTTRALKRTEGTLNDRIFSSIKTGLTMTLTTLSALIIGLIISNSPVLKTMFLIILIGLITDIFITYLFNAPILKMYIEKNG